MTQSVPKLRLSSSRDIPFDNLMLSQSNVRRVKCGVSIGELAEDIVRRTLLQSLNVRPMLDGRTHHLKFSDLDMAGDAKPGGIVELRSWTDAKGKERLSLATRSDLPLEAQLSARGATWVDRQLIAKEPLVTGHGFGDEVRSAMADRADHLVKEGLSRRQGQRLLFARDLIDTSRARELTDIATQIAERTGIEHRPTSEGKHVTGIYRERMTLASGRFAMIDNGMGFELVPWRPAMDQHLGERISGVIKSGGGIELTIGGKRGLGI
jgi:Protein of unknown function (DUF3363)